VANFESEDDLERLLTLAPKALLCNSLLEHVLDRPAAARSISQLLPAGGRMLLTVPNSYPYHADPRDTLFRPSPTELADLFPELDVLAERIIPCHSFGDELRAVPIDIPKMLLRSLVPFIKPKRWLSTMHRWSWLFRPYRVTGLVLTRTP
jgi:hypothetical protein